MTDRSYAPHCRFTIPGDLLLRLLFLWLLTIALFGNLLSSSLYADIFKTGLPKVMSAKDQEKTNSNSLKLGPTTKINLLVYGFQGSKIFIAAQPKPNRIVILRPRQSYMGVEYLGRVKAPYGDPLAQFQLRELSFQMAIGDFQNLEVEIPQAENLSQMKDAASIKNYFLEDMKNFFDGNDSKLEMHGAAEYQMWMNKIQVLKLAEKPVSDFSSYVAAMYQLPQHAGHAMSIHMDVQFGLLKTSGLVKEVDGRDLMQLPTTSCTEFVSDEFPDLFEGRLSKDSPQSFAVGAYDLERTCITEDNQPGICCRSGQECKPRKTQLENPPVNQDGLLESCGVVNECNEFSVSSSIKLNGKACALADQKAGICLSGKCVPSSQDQETNKCMPEGFSLLENPNAVEAARLRDGTPCGESKICVDGKCVDFDINNPRIQELSNSMRSELDLMAQSLQAEVRSLIEKVGLAMGTSDISCLDAYGERSSNGVTCELSGQNDIPYGFCYEGSCKICRSQSKNKLLGIPDCPKSKIWGTRGIRHSCTEPDICDY